MLSINQAIELGKMIYKLADKLNVKIELIDLRDGILIMVVYTAYNKFDIPFHNVEKVDFSSSGTYERVFALIISKFFKRS